MVKVPTALKSPAATAGTIPLDAIWESIAPKGMMMAMEYSFDTLAVSVDKLPKSAVLLAIWQGAHIGIPLTVTALGNPEAPRD